MSLLAALREQPNVSVLVIEAGISNPQDVAEIMTPGRAFETRGGVHDWSYKTGMIDRPEYTRIEKPNTRKGPRWQQLLELLYLDPWQRWDFQRLG